MSLRQENEMKTAENENIDEQLVSIAMKLILNAGDARLKLQEAVKWLKTFDFGEADGCMKEAEGCLRKAHIAQTEVIQNEAGGMVYPPSMLFNHAQDTLMTIMSEYNMVKDMVELFWVLYEKIESKGE